MREPVNLNLRADHTVYPIWNNREKIYWKLKKNWVEPLGPMKQPPKSNIHITRVSKVKEKEAEIVVEEITANDFPELVKKTSYNNRFGEETAYMKNQHTS